MYRYPPVSANILTLTAIDNGITYAGKAGLVRIALNVNGAVAAGLILINIPVTALCK